MASRLFPESMLGRRTSPNAMIVATFTLPLSAWWKVCTYWFHLHRLWIFRNGFVSKSWLSGFARRDLGGNSSAWPWPLAFC
jgi:hypothetical protein